MHEKIYISEDGLQRLKAELAELMEKRIEVANTIESARNLGDLRENAEYHAAKEAQAHVHARIRDLEDKIARAAIVDGEAIDDSKAYVGAKVRVLNRKTKKEMTYQLVSPVEADMAAGKISTKSPVGKALLGKSSGEVVVARVPAGDLELEIIDITR